jgi:hypothetical protein
MIGVSNDGLRRLGAAFDIMDRTILEITRSRRATG